MKNQISSIIRAWLTFLAGIGTMLAAQQIIPAADANAVNQVGADMINPLSVLLGTIAAGLARLLIAWILSFRSRGQDWLPQWVIWIGLAGFFAWGLPACSNSQIAAAKEMPIQACALTDHGTVCYSSKSGLSLTVDRRSSK